MNSDCIYDPPLKEIVSFRIRNSQCTLRNRVFYTVATNLLTYTQSELATTKQGCVILALPGYLKECTYVTDVHYDYPNGAEHRHHSYGAG